MSNKNNMRNKNKMFSKFNKLIILLAFVIFCLFAFLPIVKAETIEEQAIIETEIEESIDKVLQDYLANNNLNDNIKNEINKAIDDYLADIDRATFEKLVKENIKNALMGSGAKLQLEDQLQNSIVQNSSETLKTNLNKLQDMFEKAIEDKTYEYSNTIFDEKVGNEIAVQMRKAINSYNSSCYNYYTDENGREYSSLKPGAQLINDSTANTMISAVVNNLKRTTTIGTQLSNTIKNNVREYIYLGDLVTDYLYTEDMIVDAANANGGNLSKVDRLANYIKGDQIIADIRAGLDVTITDELKEILKNSVNEYLKNYSGKAVFNDIKTGIYYYINDNGGFDNVIENGFSDKANKYISDQITKIVGSNIQYQVAPYVAALVEDKLDGVLVEVANNYVSNGVEQLIKDSVPSGIMQRFEKSLSDIMQENLGTYANSYLKNLVNNGQLKNLINSQFRVYTSEDYAYEILYNVGTKWEYTYDENGNVTNKYEVDTTCLTFAKTTLLSSIKAGVASESKVYMNGNQGYQIIKLAKQNVYDLFVDEIMKPLVLEIDKVMSNWINSTIVTDIWNAIKEKIYVYLKAIENDAKSFQYETGILLGNILMEVRYDNQPSYNGKISLEDLSDRPNLISAQRGEILVPRHSSYMPLEDATVEVGYLSRYQQLVEDSSTSMIMDSAYTSISLTNPFQENPYGYTYATPFGTFGIPGPAGISRTIAQYSAKGIRNLEPIEAYILSHPKNTSCYPDYVQMAYWNLDGKTEEEEVGIVDSGLIEEVMTIIRIASTINNMNNLFSNVFNSTTTLINMNYSNIINYNSNFWSNLNFNNISNYFKNINFQNIFNNFSLSGWFEGFTITNFFDNILTLKNLEQAGMIVDYMLRNGGLSIQEALGALFWSPLNPYASSLNGSQLVQIYRECGQIYQSSNAFMDAMKQVYEDASKLFLPSQREIVDGKALDDPNAAMELYAEAKEFEYALNNWNNFKKENGTSLVDRTDYSKVEVSYSKNTDEILVGPFTIDYIREFYVPLSMNYSQLVDPTTNIISYTGITDAVLYADDAKTIEISNWKFVYPDKERTERSPYDSQYEYPYPNEVFYLQFPSMENYSINTLSKMQFQLEKMDADGQVYELKGGYDQLLWVGVDVPIVCPLPPLRCIHGQLGGHVIPPSGWCPVLLCPIHNKGAAPLPYHMALNGHLFGHLYYCQQVPLGKDLHAMNLEQILYSKIYKEYQYIDIELGEEKPYYVTSVNTTQNMEYSENKGNITLETGEVPVLPFLPNYDTYPGYPNYPYYQGNPNYPDNPYTFNNEEYKDYASYPWYTGKGPAGASDPMYPYYPKDEVIPLTFHVSGTVWLDNPSGKEIDANGIIDENERGIPNVEVIIYKKGDPDYIAKTLTDEKGYYIFEYVRVGFDYYVEFAYDGMTYKTTEYLQSDVREHGSENLSNQTQKYINNPENYLTSSHAIEDVNERDAFNDKFYHISENEATAKDNSKIGLEYKTWQTPNGAVSTLITTDKREITKEEFKMYARTMETDLYFPVDNQYQVEFYDLDLYGDRTDMYKKTYPCLEHVNLGLIQREQGDFTTKTDTYQVITTIKEDIQRYKYDDKEVKDNTYDILFRNGDYYTQNPYNQELNPDDCSYRFDSTYGENANIVSTVLNEKDELNVYIEYKILMKNRGTLESSRLIEVENSFDQNLEYISKYDFTDLASWIEIPMDGTDDTYKEEILWHYRDGIDNGYSTIYTNDLQEKSLRPGETIEIHLILKVKKDEERNLKMDLSPTEFKQDITEITVYSYDEGLIDKTSNPGSARLGYSRTYADGTDSSPLLKLIYDRDYNVLNSNTIQGYAWEDLVTNRVPQNNQLISNGVIDEREKKINDIKVELVEVVINKETGKEVEVLRKTASGTEYYRTGEDIRVDGQVVDIQPGEYKFLKLETGTYRVKFTYGDEYQLTRDLTYNAQDYKTLSLDTIYQQYYAPKLEVMLMLDTSEAMLTDDKGNLMRKAITPLVDDLYNNIQTVKIGGYMFSEPGVGNVSAVDLTEKPNANALLNLFNDQSINSGKTLSDTIEDALKKFSNDANSKVIVIMTDGYMKQSAKDKAALEKAAKQGVKIITIACSTDEWDASTFGTEEHPTTGILYNIRHLNCTQYVSEVALEDILLEFEKILPNLTDAKDVEYSYSYYIQKVLSEDIYSRKRNVDYSSTMVNENAEVLNIENIRKLQRQLENTQDEAMVTNLKSEITNKIKDLAENTKVTAITPNRNITFLLNKERTENVNLGLVERPKVELKVEEKVDSIQIKLANGEILIDTDKNLIQNVQEIPNDKYNIFMDEEIMQGATINIKYKITVTNNGNIDTLADYFTYDIFNEEETYYATTTVANKIGTIYDYFTNNTFRPVDNTNLEVEVNNVVLDGLEFDDVTLKNWEELVQKGKTLTPTISKIYTRLQDDGQSVALKEKITWKDAQTIDLNSDAESQIDNETIRVVETKSLRDTPIYPSTSKETLNGSGVASISFYVNYSKQISAQDTTDTLMYRNSTEIVERLNSVGRRDYIGVTGNYIPQTEEITEYDSEIAEDVIILPPFGEDKNYTLYIVIAISAALIAIGGIFFIKKKVI